MASGLPGGHRFGPLMRWQTLIFLIRSVRWDRGFEVFGSVFLIPGSMLTMQIFGPFRVSTSQPLSGAQRLQPPTQIQSPPSRSAGPVDQLDLSSAASRLDLMSSLSGAGEIRTDRVADLRREIASGNYDTAEKLDMALDRMLDRLA